MDFAVGIILFIAGMVASIILGYSMIPALLLGLVIFTVLGLRRGFGIRQLAAWGLDSVKDSLVVIKVMLVIGLVTAAWRLSGTISVFVYYGIRIITPSLFLVITFLLACFLSYALGTSFGVTATLGVIFISLARSGGVNPAITAGVIMSGVFFGDRCSPVSSSANLVAGVTHTDILYNVKLMMKTCAVPFAITLAIYTYLSFRNPIMAVDPEILRSFEETFSLSPVAFIPAVLVLVLPLIKVGVTSSILISAAAGAVIAYFVQSIPLAVIVRSLLLGYESQDAGLSSILNGGGMSSMIEVVAILIISCAYSGILKGTGMIDPVNSAMEKCCRKIGRFATCVIIGIAGNAIFCNQTISTLLAAEVLSESYEKTGGSNQELAMDIENSSIVIAGTIPWCLACKGVLTFMNIGNEAVPYAVYLFLIPVCYFFTKRFWFEDGRRKEKGRGKEDR